MVLFPEDHQLQLINTMEEKIKLLEEAGIEPLLFSEDGGLSRNGELAGTWRFWPDGSMELNLPSPDGVLVQERIWFTRANLRLRSTTAVNGEGVPLQGSFCTDIRRVSKPAA